MSKSVLIVDDETLLCRTLANAIRDAGHLAVTADSAEAAMHLLATHRSITGNRVLHETCEQMSVMRQPVRERRAVVEHVLVGALASFDRRFKRRIGLPERENAELNGGKRRL